MALDERRSLRSSNPILCRPQFRRRGGQKTIARDPQAEVAVTRDRIRARTDLEPVHEEGPVLLPSPVGDLMTMDTVLPRAAAGLGATLVAAALSWTLLPLIRVGTATSYGVVAVSALVAAALVVAQCRRNRPSASLTLAFAASQGVFLGSLATTVSSHLSPGVLVQLVLGTIAAGGGALLAQTLHWMRANRRFSAFVGAALLGAGLVALTDWMLWPLTGVDSLGLRPLGLGIGMGVLGVVLGASFLPLYFRQIEDGIAGGAARDHSWLAAFGLALTPVWLYVETARLCTLYPAEELY